MASTPALTARSLDSVDTTALVLFLAASDEPGGARVLADLPETVAEELQDAVAALRLRGRADETTVIPASPVLRASVVVLTGLGDLTGAEPTTESVRRAAGAAARALSGHRSAAIVPPADTADLVAAAYEGALLGRYSFGAYRSKPVEPLEIQVVTGKHRSKDVKTALARSEVLAGAVNAVRDLVNTSPADLTPAVFADTARTLAAGTKVKVTVADLAALRAGGYGGIVAVGQGSVNEPRLVTLSYSPARAKAHVALVGKGITFDSGGLSLKPPTSMITMKSDMAGAAAVLHTVLAAAELGLPVAVTGYLALAENMPSGTAQRPSDVITMRGGKTVEVLNTDAEGRLVMADALVDAVALEPDAVIDVATLTGAQLVALGTRTTGVMGTDGVRDAVVAAAGEAGEGAWGMPLPEELRAGLDSPIADLANIGGKFGGMLVAAVFLQQFVGETPWAHLDIAGPSFNEGKPWGCTPKGGTGSAVPTLLAYLENVAATGQTA